MGRKLSGRCKQEVILKRQLHPERKYVIIHTEIPLVAWYYPDTKKSASHIYHGDLMEKRTFKNRRTKQICLVTIKTYRARVIEKLLRIPGKKRKNVAFLGFWHSFWHGMVKWGWTATKDVSEQNWCDRATLQELWWDRSHKKGRGNRHQQEPGVSGWGPCNFDPRE